MFQAVWGTVLGLAFLFAVNPVLLAVIVLLISRPRPVPNLLAYWVGTAIVNVPCFLVPLVLVHLTPTFTTFAEDSDTSGANSVGRYIQLGMGVLALSIATLLVVRSTRDRKQVPVLVGNTSVPALDSNTTDTIPSPFGPRKDAAPQGESPLRRLLDRLQDAWEDGALWVAFVFGLAGFPPPLLVLYVDTAIVASGAGIGTQVIAVLVFVVAMFAVVEVTLVSYLAAPAKTLAVLRPLHDWALAHRRQILIAILAVVGILQVAKGTGTL